MLFPSVDRPPLRSPHWVRYHVITIATVIVLIVLFVQTLRRTASEWQQVYVEAGRHFIAGQDFYVAGIGYAYPRFMAMLAAPLALVPEWVSRTTWCAFSALAMV